MQVDRLALIRALKTVTPVTERRNTIPILGAVRIHADTSLAIEATDLDISVRTSLEYTGSRVSYCQAAADKLIPLLKASSASAVTIEHDKEKGATLAPGELSAKLGHGHSEADWPTLTPVSDHWSAQVGTEFMDKLKRVSLAASTEETRYYLNGVYFHHVADWTYRLVATDGHRLIYANVELPDAPDGKELAHIGGGNGSGGIIIPRKAIATLMRLHAERRDEPIRFTICQPGPSNDKPDAAVLAKNVGKTQVRFAIGETEMRSKLIDGTFPDYTRVIPQEGAHTSEMALADLRRVAGALVDFLPERTRALKLRFEKEKLIVEANSPEQGVAQLTIPSQTRGGDFEVGFNGRYLLSALTAAGGEVVHFSTESTSAPTLFYDPASTDVRTILMPMRV